MASTIPSSPNAWLDRDADPLALHAYALRHGDGVLSREEVIEAAFGE